MSSVGQIVGGIAGGIIGVFAGGNVMLGASIGMAIGGAIDPPKGPKLEGPRLSDLSVQTATYGATIPTVYGDVATFGNIFWIENNQLKETSKTEGGGKGGSKPESTTYSYSATFALGVALGPITAVKRIWCGGKLIYDGAATGLSSIIASNDNASFFTVYLGDNTQLPNPRMQATLGAANTPAFRGLAYIVFEDFQLADFGNSLLGAQFKVEVTTEPVTRAWTKKWENNATGVIFNYYNGYGIGNPYIFKVENGVIYATIADSTLAWLFDALTGQWITIENCDVQYSAVSALGEYNNYWVTAGRLPSGEGGSEFLYLKYGSNVGLIQRGPMFQSSADGNFYASGERLDTAMVALRVGKSLPAAYTIRHLCIDWTGLWIFVLTNDQDYYVIESDGGAVVEEGSCAASFGTTYARGAGSVFNWSMDYQNRDCALSSSSNLRFYKMNSDKTITEVAYISTTVGGSVSPHAALLKNKVIYEVVDSCADAIAWQWTGEATTTLASIVSAESLKSRMLSAGDIDVTALTQIVRGYKTAQADGAIRSAIEPLRTAFRFDAIESGYKIAYRLRGSASVATITEDELGAVGGTDETAPRVTKRREMSSQLPRRVEISYLDAAREYDQGEQAAERMTAIDANVLRVELPVVMSEDEAAQTADVLASVAWAERTTFSFSLPPTRQQLEPGDVVTLNESGTVFSVRLESINNLPDGRVECSGKGYSSGTYTSTAKGETGIYTGQVISLPVAAKLTLIDGPALDSISSSSGVLAALSPMVTGWKGGVVCRSDDDGATWTGVVSVASPGAIQGLASTLLPYAPTTSLDKSNTLNVKLLTGSLASVTDAQLANGANHFALGAHGRWEIVAAKTVVQELNDTFTLSNLMRGRFGTEWAAGLHTAADTIVLLDELVLRQAPLAVSAINVGKQWCGVTNDMTVDSATKQDFTYTGENIKPLAPIQIKAYVDAANTDIVLSFERRSRTACEPFSGIATPVGETSESYDLEIYSSGFGALKRTFAGQTTKGVTYTAAMQTADFGGAPSDFGFKAYQNGEIGRGRAALASIAPATGDVVLEDPTMVSLLHFEGNHGDLTVTDKFGIPWTRNNGAQISTTQKKFGGSSMYNNGYGCFLNTTHQAFKVSVGNPWCAQFRIYALGIPNDSWMVILAADVVLGARNGVLCMYTPTYGYIHGTTSFSLNAWHSLEITCDGTHTYGFLDGNLECFAANIAPATTAAYVGGDPGQNRFNGYTDEFAFWKKAGHTSNYTPLGAPFV